MNGVINNKDNEPLTIDYFIKRDERLFAEFREDLKGISDQARNECDRVMKIYKTLAWCLAIVIAAGIGAGSYIYGRTLNSFKDQMTAEMEAQIHQQFEQERVREVVKRVAKEIVAEQIDPEHVKRIVSSFLETYEVQIEKETTRSLSRVRQSIDVIMLMNKAGLDINALNKLSEIAGSPDYAEDLRVEARETVRKIIDQIVESKKLGIFDSDRTPYMDIEVLGSDPRKWLHIDDFRREYQKMPWSSRPACLDFLWKQDKRFWEYERLSFIYSVIKTEKNPYAVFSACDIMNREAKIDRDFLTKRDEYLKWWELNKQNYTIDSPLPDIPPGKVPLDQLSCMFAGVRAPCKFFVKSGVLQFPNEILGPNGMLQMKGMEAINIGMPFSICKTPEGLTFDVTIKEKNLQPIVIKNNRLLISDTTLRYKHDDRRFEVIDNDDVPILQIFVNDREKTVYIGGRFISESGETFVALPDHFVTKYFLLRGIEYKPRENKIDLAGSIIATSTKSNAGMTISRGIFGGLIDVEKERRFPRRWFQYDERSD